MCSSDFCYSDERFADIQILRYRLDGFDRLTARQKQLVYCLSQATLFGRDITFDQFGKYNLKIRKTLEAVYTDKAVSHESDDFLALEVYLKRVWFSNGIYHHYGCDKFIPGFSEDFLSNAMKVVDSSKLPLAPGQTVDGLCDELFPVIFRPEVMPKRVNKADGEDLVATSACNYYEEVTQKEVEMFYASLKEGNGHRKPAYGLNSRLVKKNGVIGEEVCCVGGRYGAAIERIVYWLEKAQSVAENDSQRIVIEKLIRYYNTGDIKLFDEYSIEWVKSLDGMVDFINGFIEVYGDPLGIKGSWEGIVEYIDTEATERTRLISSNAQWFEDHSPVDSRFRKPVVTGMSANVVCAAMLGGDEYPSTAIGINLPNSEWIRAEHGSKSVTIGNLIKAYDEAAKGSGFIGEFVMDSDVKALIEKYGTQCEMLHTDLHECLGHGSGRVLPGVDADVLRSYGNTIEEARADLFALYYLADPKMVELGLLPDGEAYKSQYYTYILNGLMTQLVRIEPGNDIEEAHMRNRALIAHWCTENGNAVELVKVDGKSYVKINDYAELRRQFATLLAEIQRIKSEGDFDAARGLVELYAVKVDRELHSEVLERYRRLNIAPYKGFLNPKMTPVKDGAGEIVDIQLDYTEGYAEQMLRYSTDYATLI